MASMRDWELNGGLDPDAPPADPDEGRYSPCGCGDVRCQIDGDDSTNVNIRGQWFNADCTGLCFFCGEIDDLRNLDQISGRWLAHGLCASRDAQLAHAQERAARADEARDDRRR